MAALLLGLVAVVALALLLAGVAAFLALRRPDALEQLGVRSTYPWGCLPAAKIEAYCVLKEQLRTKYAPGDSGNGDLWMSKLPPEAKDMLKYRLMQRAIGDMAALHKIDADARGYWRLFSKGMVTRQFWNSVVEIERELSMELESVKAEAACVEPREDPQGIISEAMQFVLRYGDTAAPADSNADAMSDLVKHLPHPGAPHPALGQLRPPMPPGMPAQPQVGGTSDTYKWRQDPDEVEVSVSVPNTATKAEIKVHFQSRLLRVEHSGSVLVEGQLVAGCRPEGSTWTLSRGCVVVTLEKAGPRQWPSLFLDKA